MILLLSRGHFCRRTTSSTWSCRQLPEDRGGLHPMVTISTDNIVETNEFRASVGAQWTFLSDAGRKIARGPRHRRVHRSLPRPMIPYTFGAQAGSGHPQRLQRATGSGAGHPFEDLRRDLREGDPESARTGTWPHSACARTGTPTTTPCLTPYQQTDYVS